MTLRSELEKAREAAAHYENTGVLPTWAKMATVQFLRVHGPALLEALKDQERYDWVYRTSILVTKGRGMFVEFPIPYSAASLDLSEAIDKARGDA